MKTYLIPLLSATLFPVVQVAGRQKVGDGVGEPDPWPDDHLPGGKYGEAADDPYGGVYGDDDDGTLNKNISRLLRVFVSIFFIAFV